MTSSRYAGDRHFVALFIKNLLFTVFVPGTVGVYVPLLLAGGESPAAVWATALALPVLAAGAAIYGWCVWDFAHFGRGTPAPVDAPKRLVVRGLYRYTRNPMYVGVLVVILGWAILFQAGVLVVYALLVGSGFHLVVVSYEERHLHRTFGDEYDAYCTRVGRWFPRIGRRAAWRRGAVVDLPRRGPRSRTARDKSSRG
jgi:protein-S-isoprenylcysteine O-methyltransferase Ste14